MIFQSMTNLNKLLLLNKFQLTKSKSLADITSLIIREDLNNNNLFLSLNQSDLSDSLLSCIKINCNTFERKELLLPIIRVTDLYKSAQVSGLKIYFEKLTSSFFNSHHDKTAANYFSDFIRAIFYHIVYVENIYSECFFFGVNIKSICSTLKHEKSHSNLKEICLILLKLIGEMSHSKKKMIKDKFNLFVNINDGNNKLEVELTKADNINYLSVESKIDLSIKLLTILNQKDNKICEHEQIGEVYSLKFWNFKSLPGYLFIENENNLFYCNQLICMKNIYDYFSQYESPSTQLFLKNFSQLMIGIDKINSTSYEQTIQNEITKDDYSESNIFSDFFDSNTTLLETSSQSFFKQNSSITQYLTESDIRHFDEELMLNPLEEDLELTLLKLMRKILVSNFVQREILVDENNSISHYKIDPVFESFEFMDLLDFVYSSKKNSESCENTEFESIFYLLESHKMRKSLKVDRKSNKLIDLPVKIDAQKTLIKKIFYMVKTTNLNRKFIMAQRKAWINCIESERSKNFLKILLQIFIENIKWPENANNDCKICHENFDSTKSLIEALCCPEQLVREKCQHCEMVFHLSCYAHEKYPLFESKKIQKNFTEKNYMCYNCNCEPGLMIANGYLQSNSFCINERILRNTESRKKTTQYQTNKVKQARSLKRKSESYFTVVDADDDCIPLTQLSKRL